MAVTSTPSALWGEGRAEGPSWVEGPPVVPVLTLHRERDAVPLAEALVAGGIDVLEVTLRTPVALRCIEAIAKALPRASVGAGTIVSAADARAARDAGARFAVSPGWRPEVAAACRGVGLALLPGVATASETMAATADGYRFLKFFPAAAAGGVPMLEALAGPFPDVVFCPTGGITLASAPAYLALPNVRLVGGSWLAPRDAIETGDWKRIAALAREAAQLRDRQQPDATGGMVSRDSR